jgi:hypothetical protein
LRDLKATLAFTSPDMEFVRQFTDAVPSIGPVSGTARVSMDSDILAIKDIKLKAGSKKTVHIEWQGDIGAITFTPTVDASNMDLKIILTGASARSISNAINTSWPNLINADWPDVGPVKASGRYSGSLASSSINGLHLQAGGPEQLQIDARGDIKLAALDGDKPYTLTGLELDVNIQAPSTTFLTAFTDTEVPALGSLKGVAHVGDVNGIPGITALDLVVEKGKDFKFTLNGSVADLLKREGIDMKTDLFATDLNTIGQMFDQSLPKEGNVKLAGRVKGSLEQTRFTGVANLRNTRIETDLTGAFAGERPRLAGLITIPDLDVHDLGYYPDKQVANKSMPANKDEKFEWHAGDKKKTVRTEPLFSKEPFDLSGLKTVDLDLEIAVHKLSSIESSLENIVSHIFLKNGKLDIKPVKLTVDGDVLNAIGMIDSSAKPATTSLLITGEDIDLGLLLENPATKQSNIRGVMTARADMNSRGQSPADLAANLDGHIYLVAENAKINKGSLNLINVDVLGFVISNLVSLNKDANIACTIFSMDFNKGIGKTDLFLMDTPDNLIRVDADVDFVNETMDIAILSEYKIKLFKKGKPMKIYGPISNPTYEVVSLADLTRETTRSALLAPLTITKGLLDNITDLVVKPDEPKGSCDKYLE